MTQNLKIRIEQIKKDYFFSYNESATSRLRKTINFPISRIILNANTLLFIQAHTTHKIIQTDRAYNMLNEFGLNSPESSFLTTIVPYKNNLIGIDFHGKNRNIFSTDFKIIGSLDTAIPALADKTIVSATRDTNGGIYFAEKATGTLYYLDQTDTVTSYTSTFRMPYAMTFANDKLYICDILATAIARRSNNIEIFHNKRFSKSGLTGESIVFCNHLNTYFVSNMMLEHSIKKYDSKLNLIYEKHFTMHDPEPLRYFSPTCLCINGTQLIATDSIHLDAKVFDIAENKTS